MSQRQVGAALTWATRGQAEALIVLPGFDFAENLGYIADLALKRRFASIFWRADFAESRRPYGLWGKPC